MSGEADKELTDAKNGASRAVRIRSALEAAFSPSLIDIEDQSERHHGHAGAAPGGETHYRVTMVADAFTGMNRVARQRAVMAALAGEFAGGLHALALDLKAPGEERR